MPHCLPAADFPALADAGNRGLGVGFAPRPHPMAVFPPSAPPFSNHPEPPPLCVADDATFWPWHPWTDFARWPDKPDVTVVLPVCGLADWGLDAPLDAEETILLSVLRAASARASLPPGRLLVLPPQRFVLGPAATCAFPVDPPTAHAALDEWCACVAAAGFRRVVLYNSSPWNEELCDAAARDIRIGRGLQMFCVNLSALGLDFAPWRDAARAPLRALLAELAASPSPAAAPGPGLASAAGHLARLLVEISARPPLSRDGALRTLTA
jgi:creatinine amidohydrolase